MIVGLFPELAATGGVQRAGRLTAAALNSFALHHGQSCVLLSLNDPRDTPGLEIGSQQIPFTGFDRSKIRFAEAAWRAAGRRPSVVVGFHPNLAPIAAAMKLRSPRTRTVIFAHGVEVWAPLGRIRRWSLARCDLVLAPSADTVRQLIQHQGVTPEKTSRLAWSLGPEFAPQAISSNASCLPERYPNGQIILTVGRWDAREAYKGVDHLIAVLPELLRDAPELHLVVIGEGSDLPRLKQLAHASGALERIHFLPFLQPDKLQAAYDFCDIFALPSRGEGFGLVFLEAMSHARPAVGGAHGGIPDIIEDGVCGYLVQYGAESQLADRLRRLLTDESLRRRMGEAGRQRVLREFTFERFSTEFSARLDTLLAAVP